jgi:hypothetical protein
LQKQKEQARCEATLASMTQQLTQLLGGCQNLPPCILTKPPERDDCNIIPQPLFDWPSVPHAKLPPRIETISTIPNVLNPWIINVPQQRVAKAKGTSILQSNISNNDTTISMSTRGVPKLTLYFNKATSTL